MFNITNDRAKILVSAQQLTATELRILLAAKEEPGVIDQTIGALDDAQKGARAGIAGGLRWLGELISP